MFSYLNIRFCRAGEWGLEKKRKICIHTYRFIHNPAYMSPREMCLSFASLLYKIRSSCNKDIFLLLSWKIQKAFTSVVHFTDTHVIHVVSQFAMYQLSLQNSSLLPYCCFLKAKVFCKRQLDWEGPCKDWGPLKTCILLCLVTVGCGKFKPDRKCLIIYLIYLIFFFGIEKFLMNIWD